MQKLFKKVRKFECYEFNIGELTTPIVIKVLKIGDVYKGEKSHYISTPIRSYAASEFVLLSRDGLLDMYKKYYEAHYLEAVKCGHKPNESWLVPVEGRRGLFDD